MQKILFLTNIPSPYRVDFFNELGILYDLTVTFEKFASNERDESWKDYNISNFNGVFLNGKSINTDAAVCFDIIKYVKDKSFDRIICSNFNSPTGMIAVQYMKNHHIKYWIESDGGFAKSGKGLREKIKKHFISGADGYFSTGKINDEYYIMYGANPAKIHRYPFTSINKNNILKSVPKIDEKVKLRRKLGMTEEKIILTVGQFIFRKGFDLLINIASLEDKNIGFYFVGGTPTDEYIKLKESLNASNVHFIGFKVKNDLNEYYRASDLFVLPTREDIWGLVINEAMANGLPVITTYKCGAGIELIKNGVNGYLVDIEDSEAITNRIITILSSDNICRSMGEKSLEIIEKYTIEEMVKAHEYILK